MKLAVIGGTGRTGVHVVSMALERGHGLTVLARDPAKLSASVTDRIGVVVGDSTDVDAVRTMLTGADAVVSALGPSGRQGDLHTRTARALLTVMTEHGPRRFVGVSGAGIDVPGDRKAAKDRILSRLIQTLGGDVVKDKPAEYATWAASDVGWTLVRPPRLVDGPPSERPLEHHAHRSTRSTRITRADLAAFLLDVVEQDLYRQLSPFVATPKS